MAHPLKVFLSHNSADKPQVENIALRLKDEGFDPWLDKWNLVPGETWQEGLEKALKASDVCLIFIGEQGQGPWHTAEMRVALNRNINQLGLRVIPVLLPDAEEDAIEQLPDFLQAYNGVRFYQSLEDENAFRRLVSGIKGERPGPDGDDKYLANPYRGLQYFDIEHADFFFGRDAVTQTLLSHIQPTDSLQLSTEDSEPRFLAVIGASGSGKSSLVRAGLLASFEQGVFPGSKQWLQLTFNPGERPLQSLAVAITAHDALDSRCDTPELIKKFRSEPLQLHYLGLESLHGDDDAYLLILVDQFEEVFSLCHDREEREAFLDNLLAAATDSTGQIIVILTMRADFYANCSAYPQLSRCLEHQQYLLNPMDEAELREAIVFPARRMGCELEPGLVELIVKDVQEQPGTLPLLQYTLMQMWEQRQSRTLRLVDYQQFGGLTGALEQRANQIYAGFSPELQKKCRLVFQRLVQPGEGSVDTRRRSRLDEFEGDEGAKRVIQALADSRLLTTQRKDHETFVEVSHEALIRSWSQLRTWIDEDREQIRLQHQICNAARDWKEHRKDNSWLWTGARLLVAEDCQTKYKNSNRLERQFVAAGLEQKNISKRKELRQKQSLQWLTVAAVLFAGVMLIATFFATTSKKEMEQAKSELEVALNTSQENEKQAKLAQEKAEKNAIIAKKKESEAQDNLIKIFEEKSISSFERGRKEVNAFDLKKSILYALESLNIKSLKGDNEINASLFSRILDIDQREIPTMLKIILPQENRINNPNIITVACSSDGKLIAVSYRDGSIRLWSMESENFEKELIDPKYKEIINLSFDEKNENINIGFREGSAEKISVGNLNKASTLPKFSKKSFSNLSIINNENAIDMHFEEPLKNKIKSIIKNNNEAYISYIAYNRENNLLALAGEQLFIYDLGKKNHFPEIEIKDNVTSLAFNPKGNTLAIGLGAGYTMLWDIEKNRLSGTLKSYEHSVTTANLGVDSMKFSENGKFLVIAEGNRTVTLWDVYKNQSIKAIYGKEREERISNSNFTEIYKLEFHPSKDLIGTASRQGGIEIYNASTGELFRSIDSGGGILDVDIMFSPNGKDILTSSKGDGQVRLWNFISGLLLSEFDISRTDYNGFPQVSFDNTGGVIIGSSDGAVEAWKIGKENHPRILEIYESGISAINTIPGSKDIAVGTSSGLIEIINTRSKRKKRLFLNKDFQINTIDVSHDGKLLAAETNEGELSIWNTKNLKLQAKIKVDSKNTIWSAKFIPNKNLIALGCDDVFLYLIDFRENKTLLKKKIPSSVYSIDFDKNNNRIAIGADNIYFFDIDNPILSLLHEFDPKEASMALKFLWQMKLDGLEYKSFDYTSQLIQENKGFIDQTQKYHPLLDMPNPEETKLDQLVHWLEERKAYRKTSDRIPAN